MERFLAFPNTPKVFLALLGAARWHHLGSEDVSRHACGPSALSYLSTRPESLATTPLLWLCSPPLPNSFTFIFLFVCGVWYQGLNLCTSYIPNPLLFFMLTQILAKLLNGPCWT